jgi:hypothetical protein
MTASVHQGISGADNICYMHTYIHTYMQTGCYGSETPWCVGTGAWQQIAGGLWQNLL